MKAMKKMPDKLFSWTGVLGSFYASPRKPEEVNSEEYIRKDTLLEWAKELNFLVKDEPGASFKGAEVVINEVIKKIQSL